ncbi:Nn.00g091420.m01.CDS01 [Neocucurbitaria sp. VM-36]
MDYILDNAGEWKDRLVNNSVKSFTEMTPQRWIRIIVIVGAYLLVRPYLLKAAANRQKRQLEKEAEELGLESSAEPNANALRAGKSSKPAEEQAKPADWGSKTKTRQRKAQEKKTRAQQDADSDKEIEQYLED